MDNYISGEWKAEHFEAYSQVVSYGAHERHEGCTGNLVVVNKIIGNPDVRKAIGELIARAPSMLALLEKAYPIIEEEAERRDMAMHGDSDRIYTAGDYWSEMHELADEISAEIDRARGKEAQDV
jgi:hypothetical protein